jgi:LacI family transcriptional regulator
VKLQKVSLDHIAKLAGVHKATVSRALRNHPTIPKSTRDRIKEIAQQAGYRPNPLVAMYQAQARASRPTAMQATLAWVTDYPDESSWRKFPWLRGYFEGARDRCEEMGYVLDEVRIDRQDGENGEEVERMTRILRTRGIYGVILPLMKDVRYLTTKWENCIVTLVGSGHFVRSGDADDVESHFYPQGFPVADRDLFYNTRLAIQNVRNLGYRRIGLVYSRYMDAESNGMVQGAYLSEHAQSSPGDTLPVLFIDKFKEGRPPAFDDWLTKHRPDAILCVNPRIMDWLASLKLRVPNDIGLANLSLVEDVSSWSGIDEQHEAIGAAAVDLLVGALSRNELGAEPQPRKTLIPGFWRDGATLRHQ